MGYRADGGKNWWKCGPKMQKAATCVRKAQKQAKDKRTLAHLEAARVHLAMAIRAEDGRL